MDYALFLYAFKRQTPERDATIKQITDRFIAEAKHKDQIGFEILNGGKTTFNGSDESMVRILRIVSACGVVKTHSVFYAIPCAVLKKKPCLLEATVSYFGCNRDNFLPRCGLEYGRGTVPNFPLSAVNKYCDVVAAKTSSQVDSLGTIKYGVLCNLANAFARIIFDPGSIEQDDAKLRDDVLAEPKDPEYMAAFSRAKSELVEYFRKEFHYSKSAADKVAKKALRLLHPDN
jgi:hypothetical protein